MIRFLYVLVILLNTHLRVDLGAQPELLLAQNGDCVYLTDVQPEDGETKVKFEDERGRSVCRLKIFLHDRSVIGFVPPGGEHDGYSASFAGSFVQAHRVDPEADLISHAKVFVEEQGVTSTPEPSYTPEPSLTPFSTSTWVFTQTPGPSVTPSSSPYPSLTPSPTSTWVFTQTPGAPYYGPPTPGRTVILPATGVDGQDSGSDLDIAVGFMFIIVLAFTFGWIRIKLKDGGAY